MTKSLEKSNSAIVAVKQANKGRQRSAEPVEPRAGAKGASGHLMQVQRVKVLRKGKVATTFTASRAPGTVRCQVKRRQRHVRAGL